MELEQEANNFYKNAKKLFFIDGVGAILSAFLLGFVLVKLESFFGIPPSALYILAIFPIFFAIFDFYSYQQKDENKIKLLLKGIAMMNLLYSLLSIILAIFHYQTITFLGWIYIIVEIIIIVVLAFFELKEVKKLNNQNSTFFNLFNHT
ncbi:hypothetical protein [uncultured Polaribacter sp.]|uniref:hypothetical protein n=1 Tax=uncultured Polaribacter sp. TaxID=174711 RepID=UPI00262F7F2D|nr:hypothetical protein [uncultured Polaribacter sp.]